MMLSSLSVRRNEVIGVGWALTWLLGERLFLQSLNASQNFLYFIYSIRKRLDWAVECNHSAYNNEYCVNFTSPNITLDSVTHWPENNWPAQQFNRYGVRGVPMSMNLNRWAPNAWYFGLPEQKFGFTFTSFPLTLSHFLIWAVLFIIIFKFGSNPGRFLARFCYILPLSLFLILDLGLFIFGFNFAKSSESEISTTDTETNPIEYFSDLHGFYRTSIVLMDYSSAFTGLILFASSRLRSSSLPMNAIAVLIGQMFVPILLYLLRTGCSGHLSDQQPSYVSYISTEATFSFDTAAVCFGTSAGGPLWALLYYFANFMYSCIGPMALFQTIFLLFIYNVFLEQFPVLEHYGTQLLATICSVFALFGVLLTMPMGTSFATLFSYVSQSSITQIFAFITVMFIYGWYNLDADVRLMLSSTETYTSLFRYLIGPTSPLYTLLLLTTVPALLAAKFVSVFDLLMSGKDVIKHIEAGTEFLTSSVFVNHLIGYLIMFGPIMIVAVLAVFAFYRTAIVYKMPWGSMMDPTTDWHSNFSLRQNALPRPAPISHRIYSSVTKIPFHTALFIIFIFEIIYGVILLMLFFSNTIYALLTSTKDQSASNNYRSLMYVTFATFHILALFELRWALKKWDHSSRLNLCIANSTMEMAFLNGYMWSSAMNHTWGFQLVQFLVIFVNTSLRGTIIAILIAIRWNMIEQSHPTHIRDATEIYDATADLDNDVDHEDNAPIIYEMHQDVFT